MSLPGDDGEPGAADGARRPAAERKARVLHTRVPESLDRHIKRRAQSLGMSASTVVRNVLLTTFGLVEDIVTDSAAIALAITGQAPRETGARGRADGDAAAHDARGGGAEIVAWQEAVLNRNAVCARCNAILRRGVRAAIAVRTRPGPAAILCRRCLGGLARESGVPSSHAPAARSKPRARRRGGRRG
jgi:hypothetical protein